MRWYGYDAETDEPLEATQFADYLSRKRRAYVRVGDTKQFFPKRVLKTIEYSIEDTYQGLYAQIRDYLGKSDAAVQLTYARYGLWHYVKAERQHVPPYQDLQSAGRNLRGLMRILLFKRFESSIHAFKTTISRFHNVHVDFLHALDNGIMPAGDDAQKILYEASTSDETDISSEERDIEHFLAALREASAQYDIRELQRPRTSPGDSARYRYSEPDFREGSAYHPRAGRETSEVESVASIAVAARQKTTHLYAVY